MLQGMQLRNNAQKMQRERRLLRNNAQKKEEHRRGLSRSQTSKLGMNWHLGQFGPPSRSQNRKLGTNRQLNNK